MTTWEITEPQTIHLDAVERLKVSIVSGDVSVTATDGPARIEVSKIIGEPLDVELVDGELVVRHRNLRPSWSLLGLTMRRREVSVAILVPVDCESSITTITADAVVSGLASPLKVKTVSGDVVLDGLGAEATVITVSGDIEASAVKDAITATSVSGSIAVVSGTSHTVSTKTVSGAITLSLELEPGGHLSADSVSGDVLVRLPESTAGKVLLRSTTGRVESTFPGAIITSSPGQRRAEFHLGGGDGSLGIKTISGDIGLLCKPGP